MIPVFVVDDKPAPHIIVENKLNDYPKFKYSDSNPFSFIRSTEDYEKVARFFEKKLSGPCIIMLDINLIDTSLLLSSPAARYIENFQNSISMPIRAVLAENEFNIKQWSGLTLAGVALRNQNWEGVLAIVSTEQQNELVRLVLEEYEKGRMIKSSKVYIYHAEGGLSITEASASRIIASTIEEFENRFDKPSVNSSVAHKPENTLPNVKTYSLEDSFSSENYGYKARLVLENNKEKRRQELEFEDCDAEFIYNLHQKKHGNVASLSYTRNTMERIKRIEEVLGETVTQEFLENQLTEPSRRTKGTVLSYFEVCLIFAECAERNPRKEDTPEKKIKSLAQQYIDDFRRRAKTSKIHPKFNPNSLFENYRSWGYRLCSGLRYISNQPKTEPMFENSSTFSTAPEQDSLSD